ncbi:MAG: ABC transporter ATP-binding protein [Candidatus Bipolaricaulia bacterium]
MSVIVVEELTKRFGDLVAVDGISFEVETGEIFGLLGPNGAGKTTTLEIIEGLQKPTSGRTLVLNLDSRTERRKVKERIGVQLQSSAYYDYLTLTEILELFASFYRTNVQADELLKIVDLYEKRNALVKELSGGQKQRFSIVASLVNDPEVVFLDEPTTGLDPQARHHMWNFIQKINGSGKTIVLTTHYMEEAELLCDRVAIIDLGQIVALDTPLNLIHGIQSSDRIWLMTNSEVPLEMFEDVNGVLSVKPATDHDDQLRYELCVTDAHESLPTLLGQLEAQGVELTDIEVLPANLEDVFLELTGKELRD